MVAGRGEVALAFSWRGAPSYERIVGVRARDHARARAQHRAAPAAVPHPRRRRRADARRDPEGGLGDRLRGAGDRRHHAARLRLRRSRPHPHAVVHRAGDDQVAGIQRGSARIEITAVERRGSKKQTSVRNQERTTRRTVGGGASRGRAGRRVRAAAPGFEVGGHRRCACALTLYLAVVPLGFLLWQSFFTPQSAAKAARIHARQLPRSLRHRRRPGASSGARCSSRSGASLLAFASGRCSPG